MTPQAPWPEREILIDDYGVAFNYDYLERLEAEYRELRKATKELLEQISCLDGIEFSKDTDSYKAEACWDDSLSRAQDAVNNAPELPK